MLHVDVKKVGRIPDGGGWAIHGRGTDEARASRRVANHRPGYVYIHAAVDDHSRMAHAEVHPDERASTAAGFWLRSVLFYREHGVTTIKRCLTDNGPAYRSKVFNDALTHTGTAHKFTRPHTRARMGRWRGST